jgi:hypothetical protein
VFILRWSIPGLGSRSLGAERVQRHSFGLEVVAQLASLEREQVLGARRPSLRRHCASRLMNNSGVSPRLPNSPTKAALP